MRIAEAALTCGVWGVIGGAVAAGFAGPIGSAVGFGLVGAGVGLVAMEDLGPLAGRFGFYIGAATGAILGAMHPYPNQPNLSLAMNVLIGAMIIGLISAILAVFVKGVLAKIIPKA